MKHTPDLQITEENQVVSRGTITATNDGCYRGHRPTAKTIRVKL